MNDSTPLLDAIRDLKKQRSLIALRHCIEGVRRQISRTGERDAEQHLIEELDQIAASQTLERARYYLQRFERGMTEIRTGKINDINLNRWKEYSDILTDSLWLMRKRDSSGSHAADYWGNFVPQIPHQMMRRYTKLGESVLDPFTGSGTTLIECQRLGRHGFGLELQPSVIDLARRRIDSEPNPHGVCLDIMQGDSGTADVGALLARNGRESVQLVMMHPPYFDIIRFSDDPRDLSNTVSVDSFLDQFSQVVANTTRHLDRGRYLSLVIGDKYAAGEWIPLGFLSMNRVLEQGFRLKSIVVKNFEDTAGKRQQKELWRYRALAGGFYIFKHEYVFVFKKR
ncbi:MAG: DNA methyltransferase [Proteobacteria bacterium]|nr:DNA methyltransferase [Pseudomonadota bacterium]